MTPIETSIPVNDLTVRPSVWAEAVIKFVRRLLLKAKGWLVSIHPALYWRMHTWLNQGPFEPEVGLLPLLCDKNKTSIDIGANYGGYLHFMLPHSKDCIGFEPIPELAACLRRGFKWQAVRILPQALSDVCRKAKLRHAVYHPGFSTIEPSNSFQGKIRHSQEVALPEVEVKNLDSFHMENVGFMKIDVEGHEIEVLRGAKATLQRCRPNLLVEIEERHRQGSICMVTEFLIGIGYRAYFWKEKLLPFAMFDPVKHQNPQHQKDYVRNFIFMRR